jgi:hypothetical protein
MVSIFVFFLALTLVFTFALIVTIFFVAALVRFVIGTLRSGRKAWLWFYLAIVLCVAISVIKALA